MKQEPLVSIGIPTFNRPAGLRRTLECITGQTYMNLEIIVSDNGSPGDETQKVVMEFMKNDSRIQYYRQTENKGGLFNFKFVLEKATGEYFMWAADDDEWEDRFIELCISKIGNYSSAMTNFITLYRTRNLEKRHELPGLFPQHSVYENLHNHLLHLTPSLIYGLHKRNDILWVLKSDMFDWWDCFFISKLLVDGSRIMLIRDYIGYKAGIDTEDYILKPFNPRTNRAFQYYPFVRQHVLLITSCKKLTITEKLKLIDIVFMLGLNFFSKYEKKNKPILTNIVKIILKIRQLLRFSIKVPKKVIKYAGRLYFEKITGANISMTAVGTKNLSNREAWLEKTLKKIPAGHRILDAGAGELKYKKFCTHLDYISQDFGQYDGEGDKAGLQTKTWNNSKLDIVSDISNIPELDQSFDAIMCIEVFEHLPNPILAIKEFSRILKQNGILIITAPFCSLTHFSPYHYYSGYNQNFYKTHLPDHNFEIIEIVRNGNFFEYVAQEVRRIKSVAQNYSGGSKPNYLEQFIILCLLRMLNRFSNRDQGSDELLCFGYHVLSRKL